ncbi:MAG: cell division protein FtsA [Parcubacteria group bacterium]|nr:cell division protein FtsA [Parcubacteria group bacterium]
MARNLSVGIDIGSHTTRVAVLEHGDKDSGFSVVARGKAESRGIRHGYVVNEEEATQSLKQAIRRAQKQGDTPLRHALVAIGGLSLESVTGTASIMISRIDGEITEADVSRVVEVCEESLKLANKSVLHRIPLGFRLDNKEVLGRPIGMRGVKLEARVVFVVALEQHLSDLIRIVENAGIEVDDVVAAPIAASLVTLTKAQRTAGCVLANIGAETVSIAVFENDRLISLEVFPIGSTDITNDIALGLKIPLEEAEEVKNGERSASDYPKKKLDEIIGARLNDIFELIENHLKKLGKNELLPAGIILTGAGAGIAGIEDLAKSALRLPARVVAPRTFTDTKKEALEAEWAVAVGLCVLGFEPSFQSDLFSTSRFEAQSLFRTFRAWLRQFYP